MPFRAHIYAALLILACPLLAAGQDPAQKAGKATKTPEIVTMAGMRSLVPSLIVLGWDDFFLNSRNGAGLSPAQVQELLRVRFAFTEATEELKARLLEAQVAWFEELDADQVNARKVELLVQRISELKGEMAVVRFRYLLRAINVLTHEQHKKLAAFLEFPEGLRNQLISPQSYEPQTLPASQQAGAVVRFAQYPEFSDDKWLRAEVERCNSLPTISVEMLLGYQHGRDAAKALMKAADQLRKLAASSPPQWDGAAPLVAQMQSALESLDLSKRALGPAIAQTQGEQSAQLEQLRTEPVVEELAGIRQDLAQEHPNAGVLVRQAEDLKRMAKQWRKALNQADQALCLSGKAPSPPVQIGIPYWLDNYWWDARAGSYRRKLTASWIPFPSLP